MTFGFGFMVMDAVAFEKPEVLVNPPASFTDTSVQVVVPVTGVVKTENALPLVTPEAVLSATPSLYITVKGPEPAEADQVSKPAPDPQNGPLAVRLPWGS